MTRLSSSHPLSPIDPTVADWVNQLPEHLQELWQERAAIREFDGGQARELAEALALLDVLRPLLQVLREFQHLM